MCKVEIVIGSGYGDEGKGLITDYLSSCIEENGCVVRFNGGAQAGHTVQTMVGQSHVFSHFGSGSLAGLPTYLSAFFVCNPIIFFREMEELAPWGLQPRVYADPACPVTTPYDIMINQLVEQDRGNKRHGSVGVGFGETLERQGHEDYALCLRDLIDIDVLKVKLDAIRYHWVYKRLAALGVRKISKIWRERFASDAIRERFIEDTQRFLERLTLAPLTHLNAYDHLVFEGAQGLLLDQERGCFPYVTRSFTGVKNALHLLRKLGLQDINIYYLTRAYTTRHGAGPLLHALSAQPYKKIVDLTNKPNHYQGSLRFAWFDLDLFQQTVLEDLSDSTGFHVRTHLAMTCLDQVDDKARFICDGILHQTEPEKLAQLTAHSIGAHTILTSYGPTRSDVRQGLAVAAFTNPVKTFDVVKNDGIAIKSNKFSLDKGGKLLIDAFA